LSAKLISTLITLFIYVFAHSVATATNNFILALCNYCCVIESKINLGCVEGCVAIHPFQNTV